MSAKPTSIRTVALILSVFTLIAYHFPVFKYAANNTEGGFNGVLIMGGAAIVMLALNFLVYNLLLYLGRIVGKVILSLTFIGNAIAFYFITTYEVLITDKMMGNVFNTRYSEASAFFSYTALLYVIVLGVIPCIYILTRRIEYGRFKQFLTNSGIALLFALLGAIINMQNFTWVDRHAPKVGSLLMPWSYVVNTVRYHNHVRKTNQKEIKLPDAKIATDEKDVCILIIGESARRDHFSLYGYDRETNPLLKNDSVQTLIAKSAATYTTAGVKAILSHKESKKLYEILPNYLYRTGVDVVWRTNNWGEPPVHIEKYYKIKDIKEQYPESDERYDKILLEGLKHDIATNNKAKQLIVLHTNTSHGPTYFKKYPTEFEVFKPVCTTVEMSKSNREELINAYDNTIVYTDYLIHTVIEKLRGLKNIRSCVVYISDHGESLGENNLYMHGVPMIMAPAEQIEIPFIVWSSDPTLQVKELEEVGQYHIFHSILHFLGIESPIFDEEKNIFK
ncbi:MAG: phosphoethanolamine--lipid A transferase EptA [Rikenellaceae bacterium]|nr:phosphoethanolamine--lipid A transferase EptA [Rikenellaceae bacterium]